MFIELTHQNGLKVMINTGQIVSIISKYDEPNKTLIIYNSAGMPQENYDVVLEPYDKVCFLLGKY